ncbi:WD40/YVTN/BNR-like repeat-containing protein [Algicola sagamiensis]|uniref:WD40/YVTN/BNR-like repeat-containing protein n=1 Tax=Algicola sagamiensis TaxID=163869 RepID=UPI00036F5B26|nr:YCF48-related protein [Algicola sagamiensis]
MKKLFVPIILSLWSIVAIASGDLAAFKAKLVEKSLLTDIVKLPNRNIVAVGERGHVIVSEDGEKWVQSEVPVSSNLTAVHFIDNRRGWAVGHHATIIHTSDGGKTWFRQLYLPDLEKPFLDVYFRNGKEGIAIGAYGLFFRTEDGGATWSEEFHEEFLSEDDQFYLKDLRLDDEEAYENERRFILVHFNRIYADGVTLFMTGENGMLSKSNDMGRSWIKLPTVYIGSFFDLIRTQRSSLLAVGLRGTIFKSDDHGESWHRVNSKSTSTINSVLEDQFGRLVLVGNGGAIMVSTDDGKTFRSVPLDGGEAIVNAVPHKNKLILVTEAGIKVIEAGAL